MERFPEVGDRDLAEILEKRSSKNTKNVMKTALNIVKAYCSAKSVDFHEIEHLTEADLVTFLKKFYVSVRKQKGEYYSKKSMISLRYGLQRHFLKIREKDIVNNADFKAANDMSVWELQFTNLQ